MTIPPASENAPDAAAPDTAAMADAEAALIAEYATTEQNMLAALQRIVRRTPGTHAGSVSAETAIRKLARESSGRLAAETRQLVDALINAAVDAGSGNIPPDGGRPMPTSDGSEPFDFSMRHGDRAAQAIRDDLVSELDDVRFRITRLPDDIHKVIAPQGAILQVAGKNLTAQDAQGAAWREFTRQGVTGFLDKGGRNWSLSSYVEMAVRTASIRAYNASHLAGMHAAGIHYFTVTDDGHPCPACFPWQHKVLTDGVIENLIMHVDGTIEEATAAGLWHPNCKHTILPVIAGVTKLREPQEWTPAMQTEYDNTQKQRAIELSIRKAKRQLEYATSPDMRQEARQDVRDGQARMRKFIAETGYLRLSRREQLDLANR